MRKNLLPFFFYALMAILFMSACTGSPLSEPTTDGSTAVNQTAGGDEEDVPDYRYDNLPDASDVSNSMAEFRAISKWSTTNLTYYFINDTDKMEQDVQRQLIREAFDTWAAVSPLTFTEVNDRGSADMEIGWASGGHGDGDAFDGAGGVLAHATFPNPFVDRNRVYIHFDEDERWVNSASRNVDLKTVAIHEIGHALGLGHSRDPQAIMFASYQGADRTLGDDDIRGIQELYGVVVANNNPPEAPSSGESVPPSNQIDSDQDGLSDAEESLATGTDPQNPDTDGDGIGDGVEVLYRLNPLDADMDKDGVNDGDEVRNGTDPFFPDQEIEASPELIREVSEFLGEAIKIESEVFYTGNAERATEIFAGDVLRSIVDQVRSLNAEDLAQVSSFDYYNSYINDVRVISPVQIDVDTCETWSTTTYQRSTGEPLQTDGPQLLPQTITLQKLDAGWFVTAVNFYEAPAFCQ